MKPPISYYGGKQNLVSTILPLIPEHGQYVEPFFGGGAVFFAKPKSKHEVINDNLDYVINFYRVLQSNFEELQTLIKGTLHSESDHKRAKEVLKDNTSDSITKAWAFWVRCNISFSNVMFSGFAFDNSSIISKQVKNKRAYFENHFKKRVEDIEIFNRDALEIIKLKDTTETFFYIDPPYVSSDCGHYKGYTKQDFENLLNVLVNLKGKFLLSSYPEELLLIYREKYGWSVKDLVQTISAGKNINKLKTECLTFNYSLEEQLNFFDELEI